MLTIKKIALGIALTSSVIAAKAQKTYTEGVINYNISVNGQDAAAKSYFKGDSTSLEYAQGPASIKMISNVKTDYFAILVSVPVASIKKAAVATPADMEEAKDSEISYTFTPTTETKKIGDYDCKKYVAKDTKSGTNYDLWLTTDITLPANVLTRYFSTLTGTPVLFTYIRAFGGRNIAQTVTLKSVTDTAVPKGTFSVPADYDKITMADLAQMGGRKQ